MPTLNIQGRRVKVDDSFLKLSPEEQAATVDEIAASLKIMPETMAAPAAAPAAPTYDKTDPRFSDSAMAGGKFLEGVPVLGGVIPNIAAGISAAAQPLTGAGAPGETLSDRYAKNLEQERAASKAVEEESPIASTALKIGGGVASLVPAVAAAPRAFGALGSMREMITKGALSGGALSAADAAVRGDPVDEATGIGVITGAAGGPFGKGIGKVVERFTRPAAGAVPHNTMNVGGVDVTLPPTDPTAASKLEIARKGAAGEPAQQVVQASDEATAAQLRQAQDNIAAQLDPTGASPAATPQAAAERVTAEVSAAEQARFQTEQARTARAVLEGDQAKGGLAPDPYTGRPLVQAETPFDAAERIGAGVAREREATLRGVRGAYDEANAVPGAFDPAVPRSMAEQIRARVNTGDEPLWIDPQSTSKANEALKLIDQTIGEGLFANRAAPRPGQPRVAGVDAPASTGLPPERPMPVRPPSEARLAYDKLIATGVPMDKAAKAVANLPGAADDVPQVVRGTAAAQRPAGMTDADAERLGYSVNTRPPAGPLERHSVATAAGGSVEVQPRIVEASEIRTSADPGYLQDLQPRNRARAASDMQIQDMAKNITPSRLGVSAEADRGAPIIGPDLMTESGNGRVLALRQAYQQGGAQAAKYREWLQSQGVDVSAYREPILVRERVTPMSMEERKAFTVAANQSSTLSLSGAERALADSRALTPDLLGLIRNADDLGAVSNRDFVRQFMQSVPQAEHGALTTVKGDLSSEGLTRVRNAVMAKAYGNSSILSRVAESTSDEIKSISNGLMTAAPEWAQLRAAVAAGNVPKQLDATAHLLDAVERTARIRGRGTSLAEGLAQSDAFAKQSPESEAFMRLFYSADGKSAAPAAQVGNAVRNYAQQAAKVDAAPRLDLGLAPLTARDILAATSAKVGAPSQLAEEVARAAQEAIPKATSETIPEIGVRQMDNARKRLNVLRGDAMKAAMAPGGSGADLRAMTRIIDEFDNVIRDAHAAGQFSGDSALAQELIQAARGRHSDYRQTFTSRGGADPTGRAVEKILGRYADTAASPDEVARLSYGSAANPGGGEAIRVTQRIRQILGPTSPEWGAYKQGLFEHVRGPADLSAAKRADRLESFLTGTQGRGLAQVALTADERAAWANYAQNLRASEPVPLSEIKGVDKMIRRIAGADGFAPVSTNELIGHMYGSVKTAGGKTESIELAKRLKRDMTPEGFGQVKQGMLSNLIERPEGVAEWSYKQMGENIHKFLAGPGRELSMTLYTAKDLRDLKSLADAFIAQVPPVGSTNPSGTAPMLTKIMKGMSSWILPVLGFSQGGLIGAGAGVAATKGVAALENARAAREAKMLLYRGQPSRPVDPRFAHIGALTGQTAGQVGSR